MGQRSETTSQQSDDLTLDEIRDVLAPRIIANAAFDGWSADAVKSAAHDVGIDPDVAAYAFRGGQMQMIEAAIGHVDRQMVAALPQEYLADLKIRERILRLVRFRLDAFEGQEEALRRAHAIMAMPRNAAHAMRLGWRSADMMWRQAGDTSTDYNYYTKRTILAGIYAATLAVFIDDHSEGKADTLAFLDRRIDGIMRFEKAKARWTQQPEHRISISRFLGRLRYPAK